MSSVSGLKGALKLYESEKIKDRAQGGELIREILSNRDNLLAFQETAGRDSGGGWIAFFQCLFQAVVTEKRAALKSNASAQVDRRLAESISLVRWMTERSVHLISRKPFLALFRHLTALLVHGCNIFDPAALDYAKALRCLLSYPPHLECLTPELWKQLLGICWAAVLGDEISVESEWQDEVDELREHGESGSATPMDVDGGPAGGGNGPSRGRSTISQSTTELVTLIPILLASPSAPILPPFPTSASPLPPPPSLGISLLLKAHRFLTQYTSETSGHLSILQSLNLVLAEMELNSRNEFVAAGIQLVGPLVALWGTRSKPLREQVVIALRTILPFITHEMMDEDERRHVLDAVSKLSDALPKEAALRWGIEPLELHVLRLRQTTEESTQPFSLCGVSAGFDFTHECAMTWAILELYADAAAFLHSKLNSARPPSTISEGRGAKRRKLDDAVTTVISQMDSGPQTGRLLALQVLIFIIARSWARVSVDAQDAARHALVEHLDDDHVGIQSWSFVGLSVLARVISSLGSSGLGAKGAIGRDAAATGDWDRAWNHAIRKSSQATSCRAACHLATTLLDVDKVDTTHVSRAIGSLLRHLDVQGPSYPFDSVCAFLERALRFSRSDVRMYSLNLEDKVVAWLDKWSALEGSRGKARMDPQACADVLALLQQTCLLPRNPLPEITVTECLPDCAIVDRQLEEASTDHIRRFLLHGEVPTVTTKRGPPSPVSQTNEPAGSLNFLEGRPRRVSSLLSHQLEALINDWQPSENAASASPPERLRKTIDIIMLALAFQASLQQGAYQPDQECLELCGRLLKVIQPYLASTMYPIPGQNLIWRGFAPLVQTYRPASETWPIMLKPDAPSGIRPDLLPPSGYAVGGRDDEESAGSDQFAGLQGQIWALPSISESLRSVTLLCRQMIEHSSSASQNGVVGGSQPAVHVEEDDFGEIRIAESDAMPMSKEAIECRRTGTQLLTTLVEFRLRGTQLQSAASQPVKDAQLINAFLSAVGPRFVQLGNIVCDAVKHDLLRLSPDAVDVILNALEESISSYAYSRDEGLMRLVISFLSCSAPFWLSAELRSDLGERAIHLVKFFVAKNARGLISSWRVRVATIQLLDEYLDYDTHFSLWSEHEGEDLDMDDDQWGPLSRIAEGLVDRDARVRFRAATSTAELFYLPSLPSEKHLPFYLEVMDRQPRQPEYWDSFLSDLLWKLNCSVTSAHVRHATLYHLYEIPLSFPAFNVHLENGLGALSDRFGLQSIRPLFRTYAAAIVSSLLGANQRLLDLPPQLCGCADRRDLASLILDVAGPYLLCENRLNALIALCGETDIPVSDIVLKFFYPATARLVVKHAEGQTMDQVKAVEAAVLEELKAWPASKKGDKPVELFKRDNKEIASNVFALLGIAASQADIINFLKQVDPVKSDIFVELTSADVGTNGPDLVATGSPAASVYTAVTYLPSSKGIPTAEVTFNALLQLFSLINSAFLVGERKRLLGAVALLTCLFADNYRDRRVLQLFLVELASLLPQLDIAPTVFAMLKWGMAQLARTDQRLPALTDVLIRLGTARATTSPSLGALLDEWVKSQLPVWRKLDAVRQDIETASIMWPEPFSILVQEWGTASFEDIARFAEESTSSADSNALCQQLWKAISRDKEHIEEDVARFASKTFWQLKASFEKDRIGNDGLAAFVDLLSLTNGNIHGPGVDVADPTAADTKDLATRLRNEPATLVRTLVVQAVADLVNSEEHRRRALAYEVMKDMRGSIEDLLERGILPLAIRSDLDLVRPSMPVYAPQKLSLGLDVLATDARWVTLAGDFAKWTEEVAILLCKVVAVEEPLFFNLPPILSDRTSASGFLPLLVQALLTCCSKSSKAESVLQARRRELGQYFSSILSSTGTSLQVIEAIIKTVLHLRHFDPPFRKDILGYNFWLDIDLLLLSEAAIRTGSYATALMFLETAMRDGDNGADMDTFTPRVQQIMFQVYSNVEDPDGFYGIKTHDVRDALRRRVNHEGLHLRALGLNGASIEASASSPALSTSLLAALHNFHDIGLNRLAGTLMRPVLGTQDNVPESDPLFFELAWRTGDWDLPLTSEAKSSSAGAFYSALRAVHRERDMHVAQATVKGAIATEMCRLRDLGMERMIEIKKTNGNLLCLREIARWQDGDTRKALEENDFASSALTSFISLHPSIEFSLAEQITATRLSILSSVQERESKNILGDLTTPLSEGLAMLEKASHLRLGAMARKEGNLQAAINAITAVQDLEASGPASDQAQDEFSHVLWMQQEHALAIQHVEEMISPLRSNQKKNAARLAVLLARMAHWTSLAKQRGASEIKAIFDEGYNLGREQRIQNGELAQICHQYAVYADHHASSMLAAPDLQRLRDYRTRTQSAVTQLAETLSGTRNASLKDLHKQREQDLAEDDKAINEAEEEIRKYLQVALRMYATAIALSDEYDDSVTRMCSLWLEHASPKDVSNKRDGWNAGEISWAFYGPLRRVPSHKFVFLGPQLAARLSRPPDLNENIHLDDSRNISAKDLSSQIDGLKSDTGKRDFRVALYNLILRLALEHPFHILYQIIPLAHGYLHGGSVPTAGSTPLSSLSSSRSKGRASTQQQQQATDDGRGPAAAEILMKLQSDDNKGRLVAKQGAKDTIRFTGAAMPWCLHDDKQATSRQGRTLSVPARHAILQLRDLHMPVPTAPPPIDLTLQYSNIVTFKRYRSSYNVLGGIHRPKKMQCYDSHDKIHFELFKGNDEIRQDAVMEQVFGMANDILARDRKTKARELKYRTYIVIPLANKTGILEFVAGGLSLGEWLKPAHIRYRKGLDVSTDQLRQHIHEVQEKDWQHPDVLKRWLEQTKRFKPVMRHFFTEKHKDPMGWFAMRLNYTRSVAVTSVVGHILGVGDRHMSNIMIDQVTGEVIHIDFGIVFEDGERLRIPEKVPFRLTQNMVDGFGVTGVDGTFRRCSEHTLRVLRGSAELIMTVLEVFKHDPLYAWAGDAEKMQRAQGGARSDVLQQTASVQEKADRVLSRIRSKLRDDLSVEYAVNALIQQARDPENLARIFTGWHSWF